MKRILIAISLISIPISLVFRKESIWAEIEKNTTEEVLLMPDGIKVPSGKMVLEKRMHV